MRRKLDYSEEFVGKAQQFAGTVNCWMDLIRLLPDSPWGIDEMKRIRDRLMELCIAAISLPDPDELEYEDIEDTDRVNRRIEKDIMFEDRYRHYFSLFWPYDGIGDSKEESEVPVMSDLVDDMYGICADLLYGLEYYDAGIIHRAVFLWRLSYLSHWGEHAIQAIYAMDHAVRKYMNDDDLGKHEDPEDAMYYPPIPLDEIDESCVASVSTEDTGLAYGILLNSLGSEEDDIPMLGVVVNDMVIFVSISEKPENLSRKEFPDQSRIFDWISRYHDSLDRHWNRELTDREVLEAVSKP